LFSVLDWKLREVARGKIIVRERSQDTDPIIVRQGIVCRQMSDDTGQQHISSLHFSGDLVNLDSCYLGVAETSIRALTPSTIATCARDDFMTFLQDHAGANRAVWIASLADAADARIMYFNLARKTAHARVANLLCQIAFRFGNRDIGQIDYFEQPLTQKQIGAVTSLTSIHVNRVLRSFDEEGLLRREGSTYHAHDMSLLAELGGYDPDDHQRLRREANLLLESPAPTEVRADLITKMSGFKERFRLSHALE
jgi:CRP-like cAMP-binding protein